LHDAGVERESQESHGKSKDRLLVSGRAFWVMMTFFGGLLAETYILYPNVFYDVPHSLDATKSFAVARGPSDFFAPVGIIGALTGIGTLFLGWSVQSTRSWIVGAW